MSRPGSPTARAAPCSVSVPATRPRHASQDADRFTAALDGREAVSSNINNVLSDMYRVLLNSDAPEGSEWELACSMILGKLGMRTPWPSGPDPAAEWQLTQDVRVLRSAESMSISPSAHAAVMAAAATLEPGDITTLSETGTS